MEDTKSSHVPDHGDHGTDHGTGTEALPFGPGQLVGAQGALRGAIGQIKTNRHCFRFHGLVESNHAFHLMVDFARVSGNG